MESLPEICDQGDTGPGTDARPSSEAGWEIVLGWANPGALEEAGGSYFPPAGLREELRHQGKERIGVQ